jgi:hypothetical protein
MNNGSLYPLIQHLWEAGLNEPFTPGDLRGVLSNATDDALVKLTEQTVLGLLNENPPSHWNVVITSLSEISDALL